MEVKPKFKYISCHTFIAHVISPRQDKTRLRQSFHHAPARICFDISTCLTLHWNLCYIGITYIINMQQNMETDEYFIS